jgi:hypothetical protein
MEKFQPCHWFSSRSALLRTTAPLSLSSLQAGKDAQKSTREDFAI